ncbi:hypothetical protein DPMN_065714 [Dreissena polymorpha]|uniref:Uncharacterized protein n=1 Tax=Dreissena polymorpha TaxID=45954 RepID=A0A9D3YV33_DREPO|nr:hypothetical protein DPMN_065714 [Dreissena polymorpha]
MKTTPMQVIAPIMRKTNPFMTLIVPTSITLLLRAPIREQNVSTAPMLPNTAPLNGTDPLHTPVLLFTLVFAD